MAGPDAPAALLDAVAGPFSALPAGEARTPEPAGAAPLGPVVEQVEDGQSQVEVRLLFRTPGRHHRRRPCGCCAAPSMTGCPARLHRRLGSELGLAYSSGRSGSATPRLGGLRDRRLGEPGQGHGLRGGEPGPAAGPWPPRRPPGTSWTMCASAPPGPPAATPIRPRASSRCTAPRTSSRPSRPTRPTGWPPPSR
ncbi:MAG: hypothetical protein R3F43_06215 [bacterium]